MHCYLISVSPSPQGTSSCPLHVLCSSCRAFPPSSRRLSLLQAFAFAVPSAWRLHSYHLFFLFILEDQLKCYVHCKAFPTYEEEFLIHFFVEYSDRLGAGATALTDKGVTSPALVARTWLCVPYSMHSAFQPLACL